MTAELQYARRIYRSGYPWPILDTTNRSVEEVAREIMTLIEHSALHSCLRLSNPFGRKFTTRTHRTGDGRVYHRDTETS